MKQNLISKYMLLIVILSLSVLPALGIDTDTQDSFGTNIQIEESSIASIPSANTYTGCLSTTGKWGLPKGILYYVRVGTTPAGTCQSGDTNVSFVNTNYINTLEARLAKLEGLLTNVTRSGNNIYFNRANVYIRSGSGKTDGTINGLGNLIIGYNEPRSSGNYRTGSHNLIIGSQNNYKSYGGLVAGRQNDISAPYTSISGGYNNTATGSYSSIGGGESNIASGDNSSVSGGGKGTAKGFRSSISGGYNNTASGKDSSVSGGFGNTASGIFGSSVSGGARNTASGGDSSVSGGKFNVASGNSSSISGGYNRLVLGDFDWGAGTYFSDG